MQAVIAVSSLALWIAVAAGQATKPRASKGSPPASTGGAQRASVTSDNIAQVGTLAISRADYERRLKGMEEDFRRRSGQPLSPDMRPFAGRQALETLIRERLLLLEAGRSAPVISDEEVERFIRKDPFFNPNGAFDEAKYLAFRVTNPDAWADAVRRTKRYLAGQKLEENLRRRFVSDEAGLRKRLQRTLAQVNGDYLALRLADFGGDIVEPRETEIIAHYQQNAESFRAPPQARVSLIFFNQPRLSDSLAQNPREVKRWEGRMQERADSALRLITSGALFDTVAVHADGFRPSILMRSGAAPAFWGENAGWEKEFFGAAAGTVLPHPFQGRPGRLLVKVEESFPARIAALAEVAPEIRSRLRQRARQMRDERQWRNYYDSHRDSLTSTAYRLRYVAADTAGWRTPDPSAAELDRYYRAHLADYSSFDAARGEIVARPLAEMRDELIARWKSEQRIDRMRAAAERLYSIWSAKKRDAAAERVLGGVRESPPTPLGARVDSTPAGAVIGDSLAARRGELGTGLIPWNRGFIVYQVYERVPKHVPSFEQALPRLREGYSKLKDAEDEAGAHAYFEEHREEFLSGKRAAYRYAAFEPLDPVDVPLTRPMVESYYRANVQKYGTPPQVHIRHILVSPHSPDDASNREARKKAESLLSRVRGGEDFAELARRFSDDPGSRDDGGDLGFFGRGTMVADFESVAFSLEPGRVSDVVKTEYGYHILKCEERKEASQRPLPEVYGTVAFDLAKARADTMALRMADSVRRVVRRPSEVLAYAARHKLQVKGAAVGLGPSTAGTYARALQEGVTRTQVGKLCPGTYRIPASNLYGIVWVDSLLPQRRLEWDEARSSALHVYRSHAGDRALAAKRAEMDSLMERGWSLDSLATLWGGLRKIAAATPGTTVAELGSIELSDSLLFGTPEHSGTPLGQFTSWVESPNGAFRLRVTERKPPPAAALDQAVAREMRMQFERQMFRYFEGLKQRYPVRIMDAELRRVELPAPTPQG